MAHVNQQPFWRGLIRVKSHFLQDFIFELGFPKECGFDTRCIKVYQSAENWIGNFSGNLAQE